MKTFSTRDRPTATAVFLAMFVLGLGLASAEEKPTTKAQRAKLLALDTEVRADFAQREASKIPETKRKLPSASATSFDWIRVLGLTPVHHQGGKPNCVAQATVAALEWNWQVRNGTKTKPMLSPQPILDRLQKGARLRYSEALDQLLCYGTAPIANYPYTGDPQTPRESVAVAYRLVGWDLVGKIGKTSVDQIKQALLEHGPLVAGVYSTPAFHRYRGGLFAEHFQTIPISDPTNHAVVIIGWDDRVGKGCWHIQNSWGLKWGEGGGMWIEYGCNNIGHFAYWVCAQSTQYNLPPNAHNLLGDEATSFYRWPSAKDVAAVTAEDKGTKRTPARAKN